MKTSYLTFAPFGTKCSRNKNLQVGDERKWKHVRYQWLKHSYTRHCSWTTECVLEIFLAIPGNRVKTLEKQAWHLTWRDKWGRCRQKTDNAVGGVFRGGVFTISESIRWVTVVPFNQDESIRLAKSASIMTAMITRADIHSCPERRRRRMTWIGFCPARTPLPCRPIYPTWGTITKNLEVRDSLRFYFLKPCWPMSLSRFFLVLYFPSYNF